MQIPFEDVPLEQEQKDLLASLVEASREVTAGDRQPFVLIKTMGGAFLHHPGLKRDAVYPGDLQTLAEYGLLRLNFTSKGNELYDVTPVGGRYYEWLKEQGGEPVERVEIEVRHLLDAESFRDRHGPAYNRWAAAETDLWGAETTGLFTDIGHACREAMQLFVSDLVEKHRPTDVDPDPQHTVARLKAVLAKVTLPDAVKEFEAALLAYFGTVIDLIQRQEHGAQKEGEALTWEDARRVVFQTALVMFEMDRALG